MKIFIFQFQLYLKDFAKPHRWWSSPVVIITGGDFHRTKIFLNFNTTIICKIMW